jgi:universal stress protein A
MAMLPIHSILVPTDFTNHSIAAFHVAAALARDHQADLLVLHVRETPVAPFAQFGAVPPPGEEPRIAMMDKLGQFKLIDGAISTEPLLVDGAPPPEIVRVAADRH